MGPRLPGKETTTSTALNIVADIGDAVHDRVSTTLRTQRGWEGQITGYTGYGAPGWVRVMGRMLLRRPEDMVRKPPELVRGWRSFMTVTVRHQRVTVVAGSHRHTVTTDSSGLIDAELSSDLEPGWHTVRLEAEEAEPVDVRVHIIDPSVKVGLVSDLDDTVMVTTLPRAALAAWNTFVLTEHARRSVPGMAVMYERWVSVNPGAPVVYLSTGAWNVAPTVSRFLSRHMFPPGPLLLTDWGPTRERWFRSGQAHKRSQLRRLAREFPTIKWLLVGDDGQHDPDIYSEFAQSFPDNVAGVAIRHLSPTEQVLASGTAGSLDLARQVGDIPWVSAPNGAGLTAALARHGLM